jgi:hypothetical protein
MVTTSHQNNNSGDTPTLTLLHQNSGEDNATVNPSHQNKCINLCRLGENAENSTFALSWGVVSIKKACEVRNVLFVQFRVGYRGRTNVTVENLTARVPVVVLNAYSHDKKSLWKLEFPSYIWTYNKRNGTAVPEVLAASTSEYLYLLVYQTAPRSIQDFRKYAPDDYLYILSEKGTVRKFDLGKGVVPIRNAFLVSNGSYVLMGLEQPQLDGSPYRGYVMILNGTEVLFKKFFRMNDPTCLCYVIPGWGRIDKKGCAVFGLYDGEGRYCNGEFTYERSQTG